jgi:hypothetical protein
MNIYVKKIAKVLIIFIILISTIYTISNADNFGTDFSADTSKLGKGKDLLETGGATVVSFIRVLGAGISIIIILVLAMKYMMAAPGDRADVKRSMIPFVIGAFIFFGASQILSLLYTLSKQVSEGGSE